MALRGRWSAVIFVIALRLIVSPIDLLSVRGPHVLHVSNKEHGLADERVKGVGDRHLKRRTPGIMNSLRAWAGRAPRPGVRCSTISSSAGCGGPSFSLSTAALGSRTRLRRCGT